jgi:hypothetical protein
MVTEKEKPHIWTIWGHRNGNKYRVCGFSNLSSDNHDKYPPTVIYEDVNNRIVWTKPISRWRESMIELET